MPISLKDIAERRERVQAELKRLQEAIDVAEEELDALSVVEDRIRAETAPPPSLTLPGVDPEPPRPPGPPIPFAQAVRDVVQTMQGQFTVFDVEQALKKRGIALPVKNTRTRITLELIPLAEKGVITRTFRGSGNTPHRYRLAPANAMSADTGIYRVQAH
jgi:hypothetical protein